MKRVSKEMRVPASEGGALLRPGKWPLVSVLVICSLGMSNGSQAAGPLYPPKCTLHTEYVQNLLAVDDAGLAEKFTFIPADKECRADAVSQAMLNAEAAQRPKRADDLRALALDHVACDPAPYYAAAQVYLSRGQAEMAACFFDKARATTGNAQTKERIKAEYAEVAKTLQSAPLDQLRCSQLLALQIKNKCEGKRHVTVDNALDAFAGLKIHFDTNQDTLRPDGDSTVRQVVASLQKGLGSGGGQEVAALTRQMDIVRINKPQPTEVPVASPLPPPNVQAVRAIHLIGHADARGADDYNLDLSIRRAEAVRRVLQAALPGVNITSEGKGKRELLFTDAQLDSEHELNRRVEILLK